VKWQKGTGWSYRKEPGDRQASCRSCDREIASKPGPSCQSENHIRFYDKRLGDFKRARDRTRLIVLKHYGGEPLECGCLGCHFDQVELLELDHINGGGYRHTQDRHDGNLAHWLKLKNYPKGYRVLCRACNAVMLPGEETCEYHKWEAVYKLNQRQALVAPIAA
jgi:hypothetical protein